LLPLTYNDSFSTDMLLDEDSQCSCTPQDLVFSLDWEASSTPRELAGVVPPASLPAAAYAAAEARKACPPSPIRAPLKRRSADLTQSPVSSQTELGQWAEGEKTTAGLLPFNSEDGKGHTGEEDGDGSGGDSWIDGSNFGQRLDEIEFSQSQSESQSQILSQTQLPQSTSTPPPTDLDTSMSSPPASEAAGGAPSIAESMQEMAPPPKVNSKMGVKRFTDSEAVRSRLGMGGRAGASPRPPHRQRNFAINYEPGYKRYSAPSPDKLRLFRAVTSMQAAKAAAAMQTATKTNPQHVQAPGPAVNEPKPPAASFTPLSDIQKAELIRRLSAPPPCNVNPFYEAVIKEPEQGQGGVAAGRVQQSDRDRTKAAARQAAQQAPLLRSSPSFTLNPFTIDEETQAEMAKIASSWNPEDPSSLQPCPLSRYSEDFVELEQLGGGAFGAVFKCRRRIDGWLYAVKKSKQQIRGKAEQECVLSEVYALAALGDHPNIVRYFYAWLEGDLLYIAMELCDGGSIAHALRSGRRFTENDVLSLARNVAQGLEHVHSKGLVHLDIKPDNIYMTSHGQHKIGDLGMICKADSRGDLAGHEGDTRYLSREVLDETYTDLTKADVFALGATLYEMAIGQPLPPGGDEWQDLRNGVFKPLPNFSSDFIGLLKEMMASDPAKRPTAQQLRDHTLLMRQEDRVTKQAADEAKTRSAELNEALSKIRALEQELSRLTSLKKIGASSTPLSRVRAKDSSAARVGEAVKRLKISSGPNGTSVPVLTQNGGAKSLIHAGFLQPNIKTISAGTGTGAGAQHVQTHSHQPSLRPFLFHAQGHAAQAFSIPNPRMCLDFRTLS